MATHIATGTRSVLAVPALGAHAILGALAFGFTTEHCINQELLDQAVTWPR